MTTVKSPTLCPASPPPKRLNIDRCIRSWTIKRSFIFNLCKFKLTKQIKANAMLIYVSKMFTSITSLPWYGQGKEGTRSDSNILSGSHRGVLSVSLSQGRSWDARLGTLVWAKGYCIFIPCPKYSVAIVSHLPQLFFCLRCHVTHFDDVIRLFWSLMLTGLMTARVLIPTINETRTWATCDSNHLSFELSLCPSSRAFPNYTVGAAAHQKKLQMFWWLMVVVGQMFWMLRGAQPNLYDRGHGFCRCFHYVHSMKLKTLGVKCHTNLKLW